jgi:hypothetical protein
MNARFRVETRAEHIVPVEFYGDIRYFFLHKFKDVEHMLIYVRLLRWIHHNDMDATRLWDLG